MRAERGASAGEERPVIARARGDLDPARIEVASSLRSSQRRKFSSVGVGKFGGHSRWAALLAGAALALACSTADLPARAPATTSVAPPQPAALTRADEAFLD